MDTTPDTEKALALLRKFRDGQCSPEEITRIKKWYDSFDNLPYKLNDKKEQQSADEATYNAQIQLFGEDGVQQKAQKKSGIVYPFLRIAACLVIGCSAVYFIAGYFKKSPHNVITFTSYSTRKGERKEIQLPDRSVVTLNAASTIQIASDFGIKSRNVVLRGEAFFQVSKDKSRPFIIKTGKIQTRVVGTSFNINAYPDENLITVAVATGKVMVEKEDVSGETLIGKDLTHNHLLTYNLKTDTYSDTPTDADVMSSWRINKLVFNRVSIGQIARVLERTYNIPVTLVGKPRNPGRYTVTFDNASIDKVLPLLADLSGVTYELKNNQLLLNIQNCR
ncbi:MAG TPA: FecR domain-containing protein [Mucilaginibacter sp.]|jgi:transmembrane sensor|nr:FecR domain-containing protein [Mucilaginibacter sp.]